MHELGRTGSQAITRVRWIVSQVNGEFRLATPCAHRLDDRQAQQSSNGAFQCFCPQRELPSPCALRLVDSVPSRMSLAPFKLLPESERGCKKANLWHPSVGAPEFPAAVCLPWMKSPWVFTAKRHGDSSSWHWCPSLGSPVWGWHPLLLRGDLCSQDIPPDS